MEIIEKATSIIKILMALNIILVMAISAWNIEKFMKGEKLFKTIGVLVSFFTLLMIAELIILALKFIL